MAAAVVTATALRLYLGIWADGIYFNIRADERQCLLVLLGVTDKGHKELLGLEMGYRESELSWKALRRRLKDQGLAQAPHLAIGDRTLGFWKALTQVFPTTKAHRCWVHNTKSGRYTPETASVVMWATNDRGSVP